jgi:hypothetical protein
MASLTGKKLLLEMGSGRGVILYIYKLGRRELMNVTWPKYVTLNSTTWSQLRIP